MNGAMHQPMNQSPPSILGLRVDAEEDARVTRSAKPAQDAPAKINPGALVVAPPSDGGGDEPYKVIRSLPGYDVGSSLKHDDEILTSSIEGTAYAMSRMRFNDCAFVMRSGGKFTYALFEGKEEGRDGTNYSFRVDDRGSFKVSELVIVCCKARGAIEFLEAGNLPPRLIILCRGEVVRLVFRPCTRKSTR